MKIEIALIIVYIIFGLLNVYCFLFQRTARKIRRFAVGTTLMKLEKVLLPDWYFWLYFISFLRFIPLIWLFIINWKIGVILFLVISLLKLLIPVDDYGNIQKIKRHLEKRINSESDSTLNTKLYDIVLEVEKKTL
jgi:hypothetical protein